MTKACFRLAAAMAAGLTLIGCSNDRSMDPPGPGPTATPNTYHGNDIPVSGSINTESRMGGEHPMATPPGQ